MDNPAARTKLGRIPLPAGRRHGKTREDEEELELDIDKLNRLTQKVIEKRRDQNLLLYLNEREASVKTQAEVEMLKEALHPFSAATHSDFVRSVQSCIVKRKVQAPHHSIRLAASPAATSAAAPSAVAEGKQQLGSEACATIVSVADSQGVRKAIPRYRATAAQLKRCRANGQQDQAKSSETVDGSKEDILESLTKYVMAVREEDMRIAQAIMEQFDADRESRMRQNQRRHHPRKQRSKTASTLNMNLADSPDPGTPSGHRNDESGSGDSDEDADKPERYDATIARIHKELAVRRRSSVVKTSLLNLTASNAAKTAKTGPGAHRATLRPHPSRPARSLSFLQVGTVSPASPTGKAVSFVDSASTATARMDATPLAFSTPAAVLRVLQLLPIGRNKADVEMVCKKLRSLKLKAFDKFSDYTLGELCKVAGWEFMPRESVVFRQGETGTKWYVIMAGTVDIFVTPTGSAKKSDSIRVASQQTGDGFGDLALISNNPRSATIVCTSDCEFITVEKADYIRTAQFIHQLDLRQKTQFLSGLPFLNVDPSVHTKMQEKRSRFKALPPAGSEPAAGHDVPAGLQPLPPTATMGRPQLSVSGPQTHVFNLSALQALAGVIQWRHFAPGSMIVSEGEVGTKFYIIKTGRCLVYRNVDVPTELIKRFDIQPIGGWKDEATAAQAKKERDAAVSAYLTAEQDALANGTKPRQRFQVQVGVKEAKEYFNEEWVIKFGIGDYLSLWVRDTLEQTMAARSGKAKLHTEGDGAESAPTSTASTTTTAAAAGASSTPAPAPVALSITTTDGSLAAPHKASSADAAMQLPTSTTARTPDFISRMSIKADPNDPHGVEAAVMSIYDAQTKIRNELCLSDYYALDEKRLIIMWLAARQNREWEKTRKRILKQEGLYYPQQPI
ncbi:Rap guanine nucleotide exchange factor-like 1 [Sorochytrium milnesiophthora]